MNVIEKEFKERNIVIEEESKQKDEKELSLSGCVRLAEKEALEGNESGFWDEERLQEMAEHALSRGFASQWMKEAFGKATMEREAASGIKELGWEFELSGVIARCWAREGQEPIWVISGRGMPKDKKEQMEVATTVTRILLRVGSRLASRSKGCQKTLKFEGRSELLSQLRAWEERRELLGMEHREAAPNARSPRM